MSSFSPSSLPHAEEFASYDFWHSQKPLHAWQHNHACEGWVGEHGVKAIGYVIAGLLIMQLVLGVVATAFSDD